MAIRNGTPGDDTLTGTAEADLINGRGGDDRLFGLAGADELRAGGGDDLLDGRRGPDLLLGGPGVDRVSYAGLGSTTGDGFGVRIERDEDGDRTAVSVEGRDQLADIEVVEGTASRDRLLGGADQENRLLGLGGDDELTGEDRGDVLLGGAGDDMLDGRGGDDRFVYEAGDDTVVGGAGSDLLDYSQSPLAIVGSATTGGGGGDPLSTGLVQLGAPGGAPQEVDTFVEVDRVVGTRFDDRLTGLDPSAGDDRGRFLTIEGGAGNDEIAGYTNSERLVGGQGGDILSTTGVGEDRLTGGAGADTFGLFASEFTQAVGRATVTDFVRGQDRFALTLEEAGTAGFVQGEDLIDLLDTSGDGLLDGADARVTSGPAVLDGERVQALTIDLPAGDGSQEWRVVGLDELRPADLVF